MGYYVDCVHVNNDITIDGYNTPETSEVVEGEYNIISEGGRLADSAEFVGSVVGVKRKFKLKWAYLNKEHFDILYNLTMDEVISNHKFYFNIGFNRFLPDSPTTIKCYIGSTFGLKLTDTTKKHDWHNNDPAYSPGGGSYDELHENVEITFIEA